MIPAGSPVGSVAPAADPPPMICDAEIWMFEFSM